jgi:hypothetical protein
LISEGFFFALYGTKFDSIFVPMRNFYLNHPIELPV